MVIEMRSGVHQGTEIMSTAATKSTELHADLPALKRLVVAALQAQAGCWGDVADPEEQVEIQTDDVGCGGSKTFQLTVKLEGCEPRRVALHSLPPLHCRLDRHQSDPGGEHPGQAE